MSMTMYLLLASLFPSTTYGYGERMCGDPGHTRTCALGAVTASGEAFDPTVPQVALALPVVSRVRAKYVRLRAEGGVCQRVRLVDKMNARYVAVRGFDLNPAALKLLTGKRGPNWSGRVELCQ